TTWGGGKGPEISATMGRGATHDQRLVSSVDPSRLPWHPRSARLCRSPGPQRRLRGGRRRPPAPGVAPEVTVPGPKPRAGSEATGGVGDGLDGAVGRIGPALVLQDAAAVDQVAL